MKIGLGSAVMKRRNWQIKAKTCEVGIYRAKYVRCGAPTSLNISELHVN